MQQTNNEQILATQEVDALNKGVDGDISQSELTQKEKEFAKKHLKVLE